MSTNTAELPVRGHRLDGCGPLLPGAQRRLTVTLGGLYSFRIPSFIQGCPHNYIASPGHNTILRKTLIKVDLNHADDFQDEWYNQLGGFFLADDIPLNDDLIQLQVLLVEKHAEIALSTCLFIYKAIAYQVQYLPDWISSQVWYGCFQHKHQENVQIIQVYHHLRSGEMVVVITFFKSSMESITRARTMIGKLSC